jgi:hypothetical protein
MTTAVIPDSLNNGHSLPPRRDALHAKASSVLDGGQAGDVLIHELALEMLPEDLRLLQAQTDHKRFLRETCELFFKWSADARAREVASSNFSNAEKIQKLGKAIFGEDW